MFEFIKSLFGIETSKKPGPVFEEPVKPAVKPAPEPKAKPKAAKETKKKRYTKKQLNEMTKKQIDNLALELFDVKLDGRRQKQILIQEFMDAQRSHNKK